MIFFRLGVMLELAREEDVFARADRGGLRRPPGGGLRQNEDPGTLG